MGLVRALLIGKILKKKTNNTDKLTINELIERLKIEGYNVTRNTVKSDINLLIDAGYNIIETKCNQIQVVIIMKANFQLKNVE